MRALLFAIALFSTAYLNVAKATPPPADVAKTVTFIFLADDSGNPKMNADTRGPWANGTGFFVLIPNENGPGGYGYLVTAKHVLKNEKGDFFKRIFLRVNTKAGDAQFVSLDLTATGDKKNVFLHDDPSVDIAIIPAWPPEAIYDVIAVPPAMIKNSEEFKKTTIVEGSDVFFVGLFVPHFGDKRNTPIFRFGRVAMMTDDKFLWHEAGKPDELTQLYLLETMSFGGNSGSPVFFSQGIDREPGKLYTGTDIFLAGVMRGNFNEPRAGGFIQAPNNVLPVFAQNIGIAAVTPAFLLHDILFSEQLKKLRAATLIKVPEQTPQKEN